MLIFIIVLIDGILSNVSISIYIYIYIYIYNYIYIYKLISKVICYI